MNLTFALSAQDFVQDIGAYAGFAAVVALALFALLLFSQAREIKRLREWGGQAHDRIGELERSVAAALDLARRAQSRPAGQATAAAPAAARGAAAQRGRAAAPAPVSGPPPARAVTAATSAPVRRRLLPAAPIGVGGPALASATVLIPLPDAPAAAPPAPARPAPGRPAARPAPQPAATAAIAGQRGRAVPAPVPAAAAAVRGAGAAAPPPPPPQPPADSNGRYDDVSEEYEQLPPRRVTPGAAPRRAGGPPPSGRGRAAGGRPQPAGPRAPRGAPPAAEPAPHGRRRLVAVLGSVAALVAIGAGAFFVLGGGGDDRPAVAVQAPESGARGQRRAARARTTTPAPPHDQTTVAVLNGTQTGGLASEVSDRLTADGFQRGTVTNASDPNRSVTVVSYRSGKERDAQEVARTLGLGADAVQAIDTDTEAVACQAATPCTIDVVVTVGADRAPQ